MSGNMTVLNRQKIYETESDDDDFELTDNEVSYLNSSDDDFDINDSTDNPENEFVSDDDFDLNQDKSQTLIERIANLFTEIKTFVQQNSSILENPNELIEKWKNIPEKFSKISQKIIIPSDDIVYKLIHLSLRNIQKYNNYKNCSFNFKKLMVNSANDAFSAINIFFDFMLKEKNDKSKEIEKSLFKLIFNPKNYGSLATSVYSVYKIHDQLLYSNESFFNFKSSTGSGKTRCAPFFFALKSLQENLKRPFFIMTQPSRSIINDKVRDFKKLLKKKVDIVCDINSMVKLYISFENSEYKFKRPIVALFSPMNLLKLIRQTQRQGINICKSTRFCLDEIHERSVEFDVLVSILSSKMNLLKDENQNFPLQLLMMSATPDDRILKCFGNVKLIELPDSQLFPVETIKKQIKYKSELNNIVIEETFNIINRMADNKIEKGHILIFTSGNARMNAIQYRINIDCESSCYSKNCKIIVIKNFETLFREKKVDKFYNELDKFIEEEQSKYRNGKILFILPIKYLGYASNEQKEIGKNPIRNHPNVIKIILATNAIESSITIEQLSAVVDSGLFNHSTYNKINGLTSLMEEPISIQSQVQRKGRVGRIQPGVCVQITIENEKLPEKLDPAILTSDITLNILLLRKIGIRLEKIKNLPDPIDPKEMDQFISELVSINALYKDNHKITSYGKSFSDFSMVSPFMASAILSVAGYSLNNYQELSNADIKNLSKNELNLLLGILISFIFASPNLFVNPYSKKLQEYFDKNSDIITLLRAFLDISLKKTKEIRDLSNEYGLNSQNVLQIKGQMQQISTNVFKSNIKFNKNDLKKFDWNILFSQIQRHVENLIKSNKLFDFITKLIEKIGQNKPEWLDSRRVIFEKIEDANYEPSFVYKTSKPISKDEIESLVYLKMRPGAIGLDCPGNGFILNITREKSLKMNFGTIIHSTHSFESQRFIPHPISFEISESLDNNFLEPLLNAYITDFSGNFKPIYLFRSKEGKNEKTVLFFKTKDYLKSRICNYLSYIPSNENGITIFKNAIDIIEKLMPFTPSRILIKDPNLNYIISLGGLKVNDYNCNLYHKDNYFAYKINSKTMSFINNIDLRLYQDNITIAMTGEWLSFSLENSDPLIEANSSSGKTPLPRVSEDCEYVFYNNPKFHSHLIITSKQKIDTLDRYLLKWFPNQFHKNTHSHMESDSYSDDLSDLNDLSFQNIKNENEDFIIDNANLIGSNIMSFKKFSSLLVFTPPDSRFIIKGNVKIKDSDDLPPSISGNIEHLFYNYALNHIDGCSLNKQLDYEGYFYIGNPNTNMNQNINIALSNVFKANVGKNCLGFICTGKSDIEQSEKYVSERMIKEYSGIVKEKVQEYFIEIFHLKDMDISKQNFIKKISLVAKQFGAFIVKQHEYVKFNNSRDRRLGKICIIMQSKYFLIPFAKMIKDIFHNDINQFYIPNQIIDNILLNDTNINEKLISWFKDNTKLLYDSSNWYGSKTDIQMALQKMKTNPPELQYVGHSISNKCNILSIYNEFNRNYRKQGLTKYLNKATMTLYLPRSVPIQKIVSADFIHDANQNESKFTINIYNKIGQSKKVKFDINLTYLQLKKHLNMIYDANSDFYILYKIKSNMQYIPNECLINDSLRDLIQSYHYIPFGQLIWLYATEPKIYNQTRTFITNNSLCCLKKNSPIVPLKYTIERSIRGTDRRINFRSPIFIHGNSHMIKRKIDIKETI